MKATHTLAEHPDLLEPEPNAHASASSAAVPQAAPDAGSPPSGHAANGRELRTTTAAHALCEIRMRSGLSWEQIGTLFGRSRRGIMSWSNGAQLSATEERDVWRALEAVRHIDEDVVSSEATRDRILGTDHDPSIFDLLAQRRYDEVLALPAGAGDSSPPYRAPDLGDGAPPSSVPSFISCMIGRDWRCPDTPVRPARLAVAFDPKKKK